MASVDNHTHALPRRDADIHAYEQQWEREEAPPARFRTADEEHGEDYAGEEVQVAVPFDEENAGTVAVADAPADEVGVGLAPEGALDHVFDEGEGGGVGGVLEGVEHGGAVSVGEVEFAGGGGRKVVGDYAGDFGAEGLNCDYSIVSGASYTRGEIEIGMGDGSRGGIQDCHFNPTCAFASSTDSAALRPVKPETKDCLSNCGESRGESGGSSEAPLMLLLSKLISNSEILGLFFSAVRGGSVEFGSLPTG